MTNDRTYFRQLSDHDLIDVTRYGDNELALVLAERLDVLLDVEAQLEAMTNELDEVNARLDKWQAEANELHAQLAAIDAE
jgi:hypothetical protein